MLLTTLLALVTGLTPSANFGPSQPERAGVTSVPVTYVMQYGGAATEPATLQALREAPPNLLHLGHGVPLNSVFGPAADYSGFNPQLVPADKLLARRDELKAFTDAAHAAGVDRVFAYINPSIMGGDHEKRLGFFDFYDHWADYEKPLGLGSKPERTPEQWMQRERQSFKPWEPYPDYPMFRYQPCLNEPAWENYQKTVVRLIAECGYDGIFIDDCIMECRHDLCAQRFPEFLRRRYDAATLTRCFGADLSLSPDTDTAAQERLRYASTHGFWQDSVARFARIMAETGQAAGVPGFFTVPNWGAISRVKGAGGRVRSGKNAAVWNQASRMMMFEEAHPAGYFGPQRAFGYLLQYLYGLSIDVRPAIINYGTSRRHIELGYAECAAGGGGAFVQPGLQYPEIRKPWRAFYETNRDLFQDFRLAAPVGIVLSYDEPCYGNDAHLRDAFAAAYALMDSHVPLAILPKEDLASVNKLNPHAVVLVPNVQYLSDEQIAGLEAYEKQDGRVLTTGNTGAFDLLGQARSRQTERPMESLIPQTVYDIIDALDVLDTKKFDERMKTLGALPSEDVPLVAEIAKRLGYDPAVAHGGDTRTVVYQRFDGAQGDLLVHAVRYAAAIEGGEDSALKAAPLRVQVRLPEGWKFASAEALKPGVENAPVTCKVTKESLACDLPAFEYYTLLRVRLQK